MKLAVIGSGYVGIVTAACLSEVGHKVVCVDRNSSKVKALQSGQIPIFEPELDHLISKNSEEQRLTFTTEMSKAVAGADAIFIAVGTPARTSDGFTDTTFVREAAAQIAESLTGYAVVIVKSTVPVGTSDEVESIIREIRPDAEFSVVSNPEFLREGAAINEFRSPDRIVVGAEHARARRILTAIYRPFVSSKCPLFFTSRRNAELIKLTSNAFLALKISFINEVSDFCEKMNADVSEVSKGIGLDNRIGPKFLRAGPGFGGSCLPKDAMSIAVSARKAGTPLRLVETLIEANDARKINMAERIVEACGGCVSGKRIAILGLSFKSNTDDMREAISLSVIPRLMQAGAEIVAYDPVSMKHAEKLLPGIEFAKDAYACVENANAMVILTEWEVFRSLDLQRVKKLLKELVIVDLRNIYNPSEVISLGFQYSGVGRGAVDFRLLLDATMDHVFEADPEILHRTKSGVSA